MENHPAAREYVFSCFTMIHPTHVLTLAILAGTTFALHAQLVITEIQRDPQGAETAIPGGASHEFVEIVNFGTDTIYLDSLFITDGMETDAVRPWPTAISGHDDGIFNATFLAPGQTALILDPDYAPALERTPGSRLPVTPGTVFLRVEDGEIGNGLANDDGLLLYRGSKSAIGTVLWCAADAVWSGDSPVSGKIVLSNPPRMREGVSLIPVSFLFGIPRYEACADSMTPGHFELVHHALFAEVHLGDPDDALSVPCTLACIKAGVRLGNPLVWQIRVTRSSGPAIAASGSLLVRNNRGDATTRLALDTASYTLIIREDTLQHFWPIDLSPLGTPRSPVKINELFPRGNAGEPEWFELVNVSSMPINLRHWTFGNSEDEDTLTATDLLLQPGGFLVVAANATLFANRYPAKSRVLTPPRWHALDNYNDTVILKDAKGRIKEHVCYHAAWFAGWRSHALARMSPDADGLARESWALAAGATPGQPNGIRTAPRPELTIGPLPFSPNGDGSNDDLLIALDLPAAADATLAIYGFSGKRIRTLGPWQGRPLFWDGRTDNGSPAPLGPFFVVADIQTSRGKTTLRKKGVLWR